MRPTRPALAVACLIAAAVAAPSRASAGVLFSSRFEAGPLADASAFRLTDTGGGRGTAAVADVGTIDAYMGQPTAALQWTLNGDAKAKPNAAARLTTPPLSVRNTETNLGRLTLGVDLAASKLRPVRVIVASLKPDGTEGGALATTLVPPVAGAFYRYTPDLGTFRPAGGTFDPKAERITVGFEVAPADAPADAEPFVLRADNLTLAAPSFYVSAKGDDQSDGRTEATAFATPQRAVDAASAGDVVLVGDGTYVSKDRQALVGVNKAGEPDRWIVMRAAPGQKPIFRGTGWDTVAVGLKGSYVEFRGLTLRGYSDEVTHEAAQADEARTKDGTKYVGDPRLNTNGFAVDGRKGNEVNGHPHHLRYIDNVVRHQTGAGFGLCAPDHVTIEGNVSEDNCHAMRFAGSGISILSAWNFDSDTNYKLFIVANRSARNQCFVKWSEINRISDGNGIIIDQFIQFDYKTNKSGDHPYLGRTLVQNNLVYGNGGSGIHAFASNHVDIVNNTAYHNAQSPELSWRQIFAGSKCVDVNVVNNILFAQRGKPVHTKMGDSKDVLYDHNLIYGEGDNEGAEGGGLGTSKGGKQATVTNAVAGLPKFVRADLGEDADFRLTPASPAATAGTRAGRGIPIVDIDGNPRPATGPVGLGAFAAGSR